MAVKEKLDVTWEDKLTKDAAIDFRAAAQNGYWQIQETVARFNGFLDKPVFDKVDAEIRAESEAIRTIFNQAKAALDAHVEFLEWKQPMTAQKI